MPKKRLTTNGNVFKRTDGRWQSVIWYFDEQGEKKRKVFSSKTKTEANRRSPITSSNLTRKSVTQMKLKRHLRIA